jgi:hypothetical protein
MKKAASSPRRDRRQALTTSAPLLEPCADRRRDARRGRRDGAGRGGQVASLRRRMGPLARPAAPAGAAWQAFANKTPSRSRSRGSAPLAGRAGPPSSSGVIWPPTDATAPTSAPGRRPRRHRLLPGNGGRARHYRGEGKYRPLRDVPAASSRPRGARPPRRWRAPSPTCSSATGRDASSPTSIAPALPEGILASSLASCRRRGHRHLAGREHRWVASSRSSPHPIAKPDRRALIDVRGLAAPGARARTERRFQVDELRISGRARRAVIGRDRPRSGARPLGPFKTVLLLPISQRLQRGRPGRRPRDENALVPPRPLLRFSGRRPPPIRHPAAADAPITSRSRSWTPAQARWT